VREGRAAGSIAGGRQHCSIPGTGPAVARRIACSRAPNAAVSGQFGPCRRSPGTCQPQHRKTGCYCPTRHVKFLLRWAGSLSGPDPDRKGRPDQVRCWDARLPNPHRTLPILALIERRPGTSLTCGVSHTWYGKNSQLGRAIHYSPIMSSILIGYAPGDALPAHQPENPLWRPTWMIMNAARCPSIGSKARSSADEYIAVITGSRNRPRGGSGLESGEWSTGDVPCSPPSHRADQRPRRRLSPRGPQSPDRCVLSAGS